MRWKWTVALVGLAGAGWCGEVVELGPVEVEAWHFDGLALAVPAGVTRLERDQIEASGAGFVPELLQQLAGVRVRGYSGSGADGELALRGFGDNSGLRVLVLVDGQPYNPADMGGINWLGADVDELATVEVVRGGQNVLYGNHALSGVVKLRTMEPGKEWRTRIRGEAGSDGRRRGKVGWSGEVSGTGLRLSGDWLASDGYRDAAGMEARAGHLAWSRKLASGGRLQGRFGYDWGWMELPGPLTYEQMLEDPRQSDPGGRGVVDRWERQATLEGEGEGGWAQWQFTSGLLERKRQWELALASGPAAGTQQSYAVNRQRRATLSPRLKRDYGRGYVIAGGDFSLDVLDYTDHLDAQRQVVRAIADLERVTAGGYLLGCWKAGSTLELSAGVRKERARTDYDYLRYKEEQLRPELVTNRGTFPNPNYRDPAEPDPALSFAAPVGKGGWAAEASVVIETGPGTVLWCGWDRVYRYPTLDEAASFQGYPLSRPLNTELDPESGDNFEAGIKRQGDNWHIGATVFLMRLDGEISYDATARLNRNIGDTERRGLELEFAYQRGRYGLAGGGTWTAAALRDGTGGDQLPLVPRLEGGLTVWAQVFPGLRLQAHGRCLSSQVQGNDYTGDLRRIPGYGLVDLSARWRAREGLHLVAAVTNLLDRTHASTAYSGGFYPGAGRQASLSVSCEF